MYNILPDINNIVTKKFVLINNYPDKLFRDLINRDFFKSSISKWKKFWEE